MRQTVLIDIFGRPMTAYTDDNPIPMTIFGDQEITRFSEVLHDPYKQLFHVRYAESSPPGYQHTSLCRDILAEAGGVPDQVVPGLGAAYFTSYKSAVAAEQLVLAYMMKQGMFHAGQG